MDVMLGLHQRVAKPLETLIPAAKTEQRGKIQVETWVLSKRLQKYGAAASSVYPATEVAE